MIKVNTVKTAQQRANRTSHQDRLMLIGLAILSSALFATLVLINLTATLAIKP